MLAFALGTFPVLALLSFGALEISNKPWKGVFFKAAGIVVVMLALFNVWNSLHVLYIL
jgi:sulfite exporter TauE/SafE